MLIDYNLWSPLSSSKNAIFIEHVFTDVAVVFPKLSYMRVGTGRLPRRDDARDPYMYTAISIKVVPEQSGKVETSAKNLLHGSDD